MRKITLEKRKKHFFIFNGVAITGKTELCRLIHKTDDYFIPEIDAWLSLDGVFIKDNFVFYDSYKEDYDKQAAKELLDNIETGKQIKCSDEIIYPRNCIIVCHTNKQEIDLLIDYIKNYYQAQNKEVPNISYVEFSKV